MSMKLIKAKEKHRKPVQGIFDEMTRCTMDELHDISAEANRLYRILNDCIQLTASRKFHRGDEVTFSSNRGDFTGVIHTINTKTATVRVDRPGRMRPERWRVPFNMLVLKE